MSKDFKSKLQAIVEKLDPAFRAQGQRDIDSVLQTGADSFDDLLALLQDQAASKNIRTTVCWILARFGESRRTTSVLLTTLKDKEPELRRAAAQALGELGSRRAVRPLITALFKDEDLEVRMAAAYALGLLGDKRAVEPLITALGDPTEAPQVRGMAAEALADLRDPQAVTPLIAALTDESAEVRFWAVFALGELGDPRALPELERVAATDEALMPGRGSVSQEAVAAVQRIREQGRDV